MEAAILFFLVVSFIRRSCLVGKALTTLESKRCLAFIFNFSLNLDIARIAVCESIACCSTL